MSTRNEVSDFRKASLRYDVVVPKIAHEPNQVTPGSIDEKATILSCIMHPITKAAIATIMLASIPIPVGPGLLIQKPQKLRSTKIISARLLAYRL